MLFDYEFENKKSFFGLIARLVCFCLELNGNLILRKLEKEFLPLPLYR